MKIPPKNSITLIGDLHQKYARYHNIIRQTKKYPYTIQLGDFGLGNFETLDHVDPNHHKIIGGNHCNYDKIVNYPHWLGDYGTYTLNGVSFFFMRGAYSIDRQYRTIGVDWWEQEQLSVEQFEKAKELYRKVKPEIFLAHDCPDMVAATYLEPWQQKFNNFTGYALQELMNIYQPKTFFHCHWHFSRVTKMGRTKYYCLNELETLTINQNGEPVMCQYCGIQYDRGNCDCGNQWV